MNFDKYVAVPNDKEVDDTCDMQWHRWGVTTDCRQAAAWLVILDPGPGFAIMCQEHFVRFHETQDGKGYTYERYKRERALEVKAATPVEVQS